jgi:hypothetical protein
MRTEVGAGESVLIAGFAIEGSKPMEMLIRGIGPTLTRFGVKGVLSDPEIVLYSGNQRIDANEDWGGSQELASAFDLVQAFSLAIESKDAALLVELQPGVYTTHVGGGTGVALVELYLVP